MTQSRNVWLIKPTTRIKQSNKVYNRKKLKKIVGGDERRRKENTG